MFKKIICIMVGLFFLTSCAGLTGVREGTDDCPPLIPIPVEKKEAAPAPKPVPPMAKMVPVFEPVYYDHDKSNVKDTESYKLDKVAEYAKKDSKATFTLEGNCDKDGSDAYNMGLGQRRADTAKAYLVKKGVDPSRIKTKSFGEQKANQKVKTATDRRTDVVTITVN